MYIASRGRFKTNPNTPTRPFWHICRTAADKANPSAPNEFFIAKRKDQAPNLSRLQALLALQEESPVEYSLFRGAFCQNDSWERCYQGNAVCTWHVLTFFCIPKLLIICPAFSTAGHGMIPYRQPHPSPAPKGLERPNPSPHTGLKECRVAAVGSEARTGNSASFGCTWLGAFQVLAATGPLKPCVMSILHLQTFDMGARTVDLLQPPCPSSTPPNPEEQKSKSLSRGAKVSCGKFSVSSSSSTCRASAKHLP